MLEGISLSFVSFVLSALGLPGLAVVFWYVDQRRTDRMMTEHKAEQQALLEEIRKERLQHANELRDLLDAYREDVRKISRFYEDNVLLVKQYERFSEDLVATIRLNTQASTMLVETLKNQPKCHQIIDRGLIK
ncbi:MAG: hypothetical protein C0622_02300 [Desulfuromonas sp.]|nr:MAG: hypothetical protein C0622_02300 [Desulfuromonas sp.]